MHCTPGGDTRAGAGIAPRAVLSLVIAALIAVFCCSLARADGDPASDVLAQQALFLPQDAGLSSTEQAQLTALLSAAAHSGYQIRVALIASSTDLGSITELWGQPASYAKFLGQELSEVYRGDVLVVMPSGVGLYRIGRPGAGEQPALAGLRVSGAAGGLGAVAVTAVQRLAAAAGHPLPAPHVAAAPSNGGSVDATAWIVFVAGAALIALAWGVSLRTRPARLPRRRPVST